MQTFHPLIICQRWPLDSKVPMVKCLTLPEDHVALWIVEWVQLWESPALTLCCLSDETWRAVISWCIFSGQTWAEIISDSICLTSVQWGEMHDGGSWHLHLVWKRTNICFGGGRNGLIKTKDMTKAVFRCANYSCSVLHTELQRLIVLCFASL